MISTRSSVSNDSTSISSLITNLNKLKQFIDDCKSNPSILSDPSLSFFQDYLKRYSHPFGFTKAFLVLPPTSRSAGALMLETDAILVELFLSFYVEMGFSSVIPVGHDDGGMLALKAAQSPCFTKFCQCQKFFGEVQNMIKEFRNLVFQVFSFFNICKHSLKLFILIHLYLFLNIFNFYL
ncbi:hypothetical protein ACSBR1_003644 [Camellia fascicularis]